MVFADPEGALQAAATPLKAILPLEITGIHRIHDPEAFSFFSGVKVKELPRDGVAFLCGVPGSERQITSILTLQGFPVLSQMRCGLGSSKLLAFAMSNKNFINSPRFLEMVRRELFFVPDTEKVCSDFASALNMLTGFAKGRGKTKSRDNRLPAHLGTRLDENRKGFAYSAISCQDHKPETILHFR